MMTDLAGLPRLWPTISLPGIAVLPRTYGFVDLDAMPEIEVPLDGSLGWLRGTSRHAPSLGTPTEEPASTAPDVPGLRSIAADREMPPAFVRFIEDADLRRHIRSATGCFLDLGQFPVATADGGLLVHFLCDSQWVLHWLLYVGPEGSETVLATAEHLGFDMDVEPPAREVDLAAFTDRIAVCADSFEEFLYRFWAMNELFFQAAVAKVPLDDLPSELRTCAAGYPRTASTRTILH